VASGISAHAIALGKILDVHLTSEVPTDNVDGQAMLRWVKA
jgi:hypothetical protein